MDTLEPLKRRKKTRAKLYADNLQAARIALYLPTLEARRQKMVEDLEELDQLIIEERAAEQNLRAATYMTDDAH